MPLTANSGTTASSVTFARAQRESTISTIVEKMKERNDEPLKGKSSESVAATRNRDSTPSEEKRPFDLSPIIYLWLPLLKSGLSKQAFDALGSIAASLVTDNEDTRSSAFVHSVLVFLRFWECVRFKATEPEFILLPSGHLQADWATGPNNFLVIEFRSVNRIFFGLYERGQIIEGSAEDDKLVKSADDLAKLTSTRQIWRRG